MPRTDKATNNGHTVGQRSSPEPQPDNTVVPGGIDPARALVSGSLATFQGVLEWAYQIQRQQAKTLDAWGQALDLAIREADNARDLPTLMSVPTKLANLQLDLSMQQFGDGMSLLIESEMNMASRMQDYATSALQTVLSTASPSPASDIGTSGSPLAPLSQLQSQWLAATQQLMTGALPAANR